ncbi:MAG: DUF2971 domain-containing protein [bacterium]
MKEPTLNLYRYSKVNDDLLNSIKNHTLHFTCPNEFNDPFDCRLKLLIDGTDEEWQIHGKRLGLNDIELQELRYSGTITIENSGSYSREIQHHALLKTRVCCFSEFPDNILMWSHYADSHRGICFMFETKAFDTIQYLIFNKDDLNYDNPILPPDHGGIIKIRYSENLPEAYNHLEYDKNKLAPFLITKAIDWAYENEWRILLPECALMTRDPRYKREQLKGVIFGLNCLEENKKIIKELLNDAVQFFEVYPVKDKYKVEIRKIKKYA